MLNKKAIAIIYLDRNNFTYFQENGNPMTFTYPSASVKELEVINSDILIKEASLFIQSNKIAPAMLMFVLSPDTYYEKDFIEEIQPKTDEKKKPSEDTKAVVANQTTTDQAVVDPALNYSTQEQRNMVIEERARQIQLFLDIVPIDEIASKTYKIDKGIKVVATNKQLYEAIINVFNKHLFTADSVVPMVMLPKEFNAGLKLNQDTVRKIIKKFELAGQNSLLTENSYSLSRAAREGPHLEMTARMSSKKDYALIAVFGCLLLILGFVAYTSVISPKKTTVASISKVVEPTPPILPTLDLSLNREASVSAINDKDEISILINGGSAMQADLVKQGLNSDGFNNIIIKPGNIPAEGKTLVIFSATLEETVRTYLLDQLGHNLLNISVLESASPEADVVVNL